jgi:hypothetical protein
MLLAAGWLAHVPPQGMGMLSLPAVSTSMGLAANGTQAEFASLGGDAVGSAMSMTAVHDAMHDTAGHDDASMDHSACCRPLPAPVVGETLVETTTLASADDMHGDHHDCCRPLPAPVVGETLVETAALASADDMHGDHHDCCRPLPAPVVGETLVETTTLASADDMHGDHHDCCRPLPAPVVGETLVETAALASAEDMHGDHHDCCRPLPAPVVGETLVETTILASADDMHGDHHDCCRPQRLPAGASGSVAADNLGLSANWTSAAAPTESSPAPLRILSVKEREPAGDGEFSGAPPLFLTATSADGASGYGVSSAAWEPSHSPVKRDWQASMPVTPTEALARYTRLVPNRKADDTSPLTTGGAFATNGRDQESTDFAAAVDHLFAEIFFEPIP